MKTPTQKKFRVIIIIKIPVGQSQLRYDKAYISSSRKQRSKQKKEASTIHPHHCSKILFQNEASHSNADVHVNACTFFSPFISVSKKKY